MSPCRQAHIKTTDRQMGGTIGSYRHRPEIPGGSAAKASTPILQLSAERAGPAFAKPTVSRWQTATFSRPAGHAGVVQEARGLRRRRERADQPSLATAFLLAKRQSSKHALAGNRTRAARRKSWEFPLTVKRAKPKNFHSAWLRFGHGGSGGSRRTSRTGANERRCTTEAPSSFSAAKWSRTG